MPGEATNISGIGVSLVMDTSQFSSALQKAAQELSAFRSQAGSRGGAPASVPIGGGNTRVSTGSRVVAGGTSGGDGDARAQRAADQRNESIIRVAAQQEAMAERALKKKEDQERRVVATQQRDAERQQQRLDREGRKPLTREQQGRADAAIPVTITGISAQGANQMTTRVSRQAAELEAAAVRRTLMQQNPVQTAAQGAQRYPTGQSGSAAQRYLRTAMTAEQEAIEGRPIDSPTVRMFKERQRELQMGVIGQTAFTPGRTGRGAAASIAGAGAGGRIGEMQKQAELRFAMQDELALHKELEPALRQYGVFEREKNQQLAAGTITQQEHTKSLDDYHKTVVQSQPAWSELPKSVERTNKAAEAAKVSLSGMARNIIAVSAGVALYGVVAGTVSAGFEVASTAAKPFIDQFTGFSAKANVVTKALAEQNIALHGNQQAAIAATAARAGLSDQATAFIAAMLGPSGNAKAGALVAQNMSDALRGSIGAQGAPQGLYGGYGGVLGGAVLGQQLGGGLGLVETIAKDMEAFKQTTSPRAPDRAQAMWRAAGGLAPAPPDAQAVQQAGQAQTAELDSMNEAIKRANQYLGMAGDAVNHFGTIADDQAAEIRDSALPDEIKRLANSNVGLLDAQGNLVKGSQDVTDTLLKMAQGLQLPTTKQFIAQNRQAFEAANLAAAEQTRLQMQTLIPGALGAQLAQTPFQAAAAGLITPGMGATPEERAAASGIGAGGASVLGTQSIQDRLMTEGKAALDAQAQWIDGLTGEGQQYRNLYSAVGGITDLGRQITALGEQSAQAAAAVSLKEYTNNLRLSNRAIADAKGLTGQLTTGLGALQRQEFLLGRESQSLGFILSQRQINFQVATAGFTAPGVTSEERAARIEQAKVEAAFAQKQLDIQKRQFGIGGQVFQTQAGRGLQDAQAAQGVMRAQFAANQEIAKNAKRAAALQVEQQVQVSKANALLNRAQARFEGALGIATQGYSQFGKALGDFSAFIGQIIIDSGVTPSGAPGGNGRVRGGSFATGMIGTFNQRTTATFGEAGTETVAILRNPRQGTLAPMGTAGGGSVAFQFINNGSVRNDSDLRAMEKMVLNLLNRKAALQGLRSGLV